MTDLFISIITAILSTVGFDINMEHDVTFSSKPPEVIRNYEELEIMDLGMYSVRDAKAEAFHTPFFSPNHATAIRSFEAATKEEGHEFNAHAEDYSLWHVGGFNSEDGILIAVPPVAIGQARDFKGPVLMAVGQAPE